jgi:hypothetical protein
MKCFLDLNDGQAPIACASEERALFLYRCWVTIRSSNVVDQQLALQELREAILEIDSQQAAVDNRLTKPA